jgi:hypothetical protein
MGDVAKVIALDDIRASQKHQALRQQLHERFDQWLDALEHQEPVAKHISQNMLYTKGLGSFYTTCSMGRSVTA